MNRRRFFIFILPLLIFSCQFRSNQDQINIFERLGSYLPDGYTNELLVGSYKVYEDRETMSGRKIPLHITVTPALDQANKLEPIFFIDGGPGLGVSSWNYFYNEEDTLYRSKHDLVFIDVRGTGRSQALHCLELQTRKGLEEHLGKRYPEEKIQDCIEAYSDSIDFNNYNSTYIVEDLEEIRTWLGYKKIDLYAISYGGKVALLYMDRYPNSIHKSVLHSPSLPGLNNHILRSEWSQNAINKVFDLCLEDPDCNENFPEIKAEFFELKERIETSEVSVVYGNENSQVITLKWGPIASKLYSLLYDDTGYIKLPYLIHQAYLENYLPLIKEFNYQSDKPNLRFAQGTLLSIICAEEINLDWKTNSEISETFLGDYMYKSRLEVCKSWPVEDKSRDFQRMISSEVPTLIFSGNFDPVTPAENGISLTRTLSNSTHVIIPYMGHMFSELSNINCYDESVVSFYDNESFIQDVCFETMLPQPFRIN